MLGISSSAANRLIGEVVGAFSVIVQPVVEPMDSFTALVPPLCSSQAGFSTLAHGTQQQGLGHLSGFSPFNLNFQLNITKRSC